MRIRLFSITAGLLAVFAASSAQSQATSDLDALMARVLARRDENWKKLQQYVLEEREAFQLLGPGQTPLYGYRREYTWFPRDGVFIRSPLRADGVAIGEAARRQAEDAWLRSEERREARRSRREDRADAPGTADPGAAPADVLRQSIEPQFVSAAYFLKFPFDPGQYALAGRELIAGRDVLRIEYYPTRLFTEGRASRDRRPRDREEDFVDKMNKVSVVTLWIAQEEHQILRYEFENVDLDFLPGRALVRIDGMHASMRMSEPFAGVWLPQSIGMRFELTTAAGEVTGRYDVEYHDYRLASVTTRIR